MVRAAIHEMSNRSRHIFPCIMTAFPDFPSFPTPETLTIFFSSAEFLQPVIHDFHPFLHGSILPLCSMNKEHY